MFQQLYDSLSGWKRYVDLNLPIAIDCSSDEDFFSVDRLYSMSQGGRNIQSASGRAISVSQIAPTSSTIITQASRGVLKASKVQKELESQDRFEQKVKAQRHAEKECAMRRNYEKLMKPRMENVSQLLVDFPELAEK